MNKYRNQKINYDGIDFDSVKEMNRYCQLKMLARAGRISELELQKPFELIPAQYEEEPTGELYQRGERKGEPKTRKSCIEKAVVYIADFSYIENGKQVVEDVKGYRDPASAAYAKYVIKRKLMLHKYGIRVREI